MFTFTPLAGAQCNSRASQSILELDGGVKVLVDVGWDESFDTRKLAELEKHVSTLSFILLTHATTSHLGAFAHCCKHIPLFAQIPVYATAPVIAFGRTLLQDLYSSSPIAATFIPATASPDDETSADETTKSNILRDAPTSEDIHRYFSNITPLKYSQPHQPTASFFSAQLEGLTLTAYNAGHTLGGTIWHIQHGMESIVYAVDWNLAGENCISGAAWFEGIGGSEVNEQLRKPTALICSSTNGEIIAKTGGRKARDDELLGHIKSAVAKGGSVLIPTDSSARILELAYLLESTWASTADETLKGAKVYMATKSAQATLRHARSLLEWMDDAMVREFEGDEENTAKTHKRSGSKAVNGASKPSRPFDFKVIKVIERKSQLDRILKAEDSTPRIIVASDLSAEWGYSRAALEQIAMKPENLVILTERYPTDDTQAGASARTLWQWYQQRLDGVALDKSLNGDQIEQVHTGGRDLNFRNAEKRPLNEAETSKYQQYQATRKQIESSLATSDGRQLAAAEEAMDEDDESSSESESEDEHQGRALTVSAALTHGNRNKVALRDEDLGVNILLRKKGVYDFDVRNKKGRNAVFPYAHSRKRGDEYGEIIKPEDFLTEAQKDAQESMAETQLDSSLGQKRKWADIETSKSEKNAKKAKTSPEGVFSTAQDDHASDSDLSESEAGEEAEATEVQVPSKIVFREKKVNVQARLAYVDFAGLHDQRSLQLLIPLVSPKKLILVGGSTSETQKLFSDCKELLGVKTVGDEHDNAAEIYTPAIGETVDASVDTNAWIVKLTRELSKRLQWQNVRSVGISTVTGQLRVESHAQADTADAVVAKKLKFDEESSDSPTNVTPNASYEPVLDAIPAALAAATRSLSQPIHVGDLRLADLRRLMRESGHTADFRGEGILLVDNMVAVRKLTSGKIIVEGPPVNSIQRANNFTQVKRKIYDGLAVIAAG